MSLSKSVCVGSLCVLVVAAAVACADSTPSAPTEEANPLSGLVQVQSPDTARGGSASPAPSSGPGFFRGKVIGFSAADFPDTLKSAKPLANVSVTAYPAELTNSDPKLGPAAATVSTTADGQFKFPTLPGRLYVVTFVPASGDSYEKAWTIATADPESGDRPWIIMLRKK